MHLTAEEKKEIFGQYGKSNTDTGSPESQIALFSRPYSSPYRSSERERQGL
jgi:ribosomal protein S15P/S13E